MGIVNKNSMQRSLNIRLNRNLNSNSNQSLNQNTSPRQRVLVISRNYSNLLCMARSLAGGNYDIEMVRLVQKKSKLIKVISRWNPESSCRYISQYHICMCGEDSESFIRFLMKIRDPRRKTLIIPCDDLSLPWIDLNYNKLKHYYIMSHVKDTQGELEKLMHKEYQKELVFQYGLPAPGSQEILIQNGRYQIPAGISYPCFLKTAVLVSGSKAYLKRYDSPSELEEAVSQMAKKFHDIPLLVEDYVEITKEYAILGICADDQVVIPDGGLVFLKGGHGRRTGIMVSGQVVSNPELLSFIEDLKGFLRTLGYSGLFDVDVLASDKKLYYCELNLRFGGSGYGITKSGVNLPRLYADYMLFGKELPEQVTLTGIGKRFVSEKVLLEDRTEGYISRKEAKKEFRNAHIHFIYDEDDPKPYKKVKLYFDSVAAPINILKQIKRKL